MRLAAVIATIALGCSGSPGSHGPASGPPAVASGYAATRWIPDKPTYLIAAKSVLDAQQGLRELIDLFGTLAGYELAEASHDLEGVFGVDVLGADAVAGVGVDLHGGWAVFSEDFSPTFVVHLAAPEQMTQFLERQRDKGLVTQSVIVDKIEVFTAKVAGVPISWAIADSWMWVHLQLPIGRDDGTAWFTSSHGTRGAAWARTWQWAHDRSGDAPVTGFIDLRAVASNISARVPAAAACLHLFEPVSRAGVGVRTDGHRVQLDVAFDVGSTTGVTSMLLPAPGGWSTQAQSSALAVAWNLDLFAGRTWLSPCLKAIGGEVRELDEMGVRAGRALVQSLDPDAKSGTGAIALDLAKADYIAHKLDDIPLRSTLERDRTFGPYQGHSISIPFSVTVDYVLTGKLALAAVGEGLLAKLATGTPAPPTDVFAIELAPPRLAPAAWQMLLELADLPHAKRIAERLSRWHDVHVGLATQPTELVLQLAATHR